MSETGLLQLASDLRVVADRLEKLADDADREAGDDE